MVTTIAQKYARQGKFFKQNGEVEKAIDCYSKALNIESSNPWYYYELGNLKLGCLQWQQALIYYYYAIQLKPDFHGAYHKLGQLHVNNEQLDEAVKYFRKALKYNKSNPWYYNSLGSILEQQNQWEGAIYCYQQAIQLKADSSTFYYKLARNYHHVEQYNCAIAYYQKALAINPDNIWYNYYLGSALENNNLLDKAKLYYQKALEINYNFSPAYQNLGDILCKQDFLKEGLIKYKRARYTRTLREYPELAPWPYYTYLVNHEYKFIYCVIPKVACSSFKKIILQLSQHQAKIQQLKGVDFHVYVNHTFSLFRDSKLKVNNLLNNPSYFKFAIIRNPWNRLISAYINKFVNLKEPFTHEVIKCVYEGQGQTPNYEQSITFKQFIHYLVATEDHLLDRHWKPQYLFLGNTKFDFIGKFENLAEDFQYIKQKLNLDLDLEWMNKTEKTENSSISENYADYYPQYLRKLGEIPNYRSFYTPELVELVRSRYQNDIEMFDYEFY